MGEKAEANAKAIATVLDWLKWHGVRVVDHGDHYTLHPHESGDLIGQSPDLDFALCMALDQVVTHQRDDARDADRGQGAETE